MKDATSGDSGSPIPCVIYAARSAPDHQEQSTASQTDEVRERVEQEGGRVVVGEFAESGVSGFYGERGPELAAALEAAREAATDDVDAELWVFHTSRLARGSGRKGQRSLTKIYADALYEGVRLRSVSDDEFLREEFIGIASVQNHKYARDHGAHVARGRRSAFEAGKWPGGPAPDGYLSEKVIDPDGNPATTIRLDPEREPIMRLMFDLSEQGLGDPSIARRLNEAGHRRKNGKPWNRRAVQSKLLNPVYAGRVARWGEGARKGGAYRRNDRPEVRPGQHPALIEPERYDRIVAMRPGRDRAKAGRESAKERGRMGGRPPKRHLLAKLAVCDRCGETMYAQTSTYRRKDGSQQRYYVCGNVHFSTGECDQPRLDAGRIDEAVVPYLDRLFIDFKAWAEQLASGSDQRRATLTASAEAAQEKLIVLDRQETKLRERWTAAIDAGDETKEKIAYGTLEAHTAKKDLAREAVQSLNAELAALDDEPSDEDRMLDAYNELRRRILGGDGSFADLNERLRANFEEFRLDRVADGTIGVLPVLRAHEVTDVTAAYKAWQDAGEPMPTDQEVADHDALSDAQEPMWIGAGPPAKVLEIPVKNLRNSHQ